MADMYSDNFGYIGKRTTGSQARAFLIAGPNWHGVKPDDVKDVIASPTPSALVFGKTFVSGPEDTAAGTALQDQYRVVPLSQWGRKDAVLPDDHDVPAPFDSKTDPLADFRTVNQAMDENPPREREKIMLEQFAQTASARVRLPPSTISTTPPRRFWQGRPSMAARWFRKWSSKG